mmetsp:Transcript_25838/g.36086  ORF Transcript_25838/g.36086 Transcript_25838/m.36086 type:complete len:271 (-) Transcript_25838:172-984(-)
MKKLRRDARSLSFADYHAICKNIYLTYLKPSSKLEINVNPKVKTRCKVDLEKQERSQRIIQKLFMRAEREVYSMLKYNIFNKFRSEVVVIVNPSFVNGGAWWKYSPVKKCSDFFRIPNPQPYSQHRLLVVISILEVIAALGCYISLAMKKKRGDSSSSSSVGIADLVLFCVALYGPLARSICGPWLDPHSYLVIFVANLAIGDKPQSYIAGAVIKGRNIVSSILIGTATAFIFSSSKVIHSQFTQGAIVATTTLQLCLSALSIAENANKW